ncbi:MAG TPA: cache domain-containing protein [bacterium]|nr:HAMP domain-containing protein [Myxococcales bacterium]OQA60200.1 MAG: Methyl-accepting chemotaxis protein McpB [bacterium ADurb.Bin270]HPW45745.1 cache domain-containing protein [bacterium]HQG13320.1 cache domain-containing protein [bacterium]HQH80390.1 cache domain-containing protein [bacterium]
MKIRDQLLVSVLLLSAFVISFLIAIGIMTMKGLLVSQVGESAKNMQKSYAWKLNANIKAAEMIAEEIAVAVETLRPANEAEIASLIQATLTAHPELCGSAVAFEPGEFSQEEFLVAQYYYRSKDGYKQSDLTAPGYNYARWEWFTVPRKTGRGSWGIPYVDEGGGGTAMVTFSQPFNKDGKFWGVATVDLAISDLTDEIDSISVGEGGYAFLLSSSGSFLSMKGDDWNIDRTIFDLAAQKNDQQIKKLGLHMVGGLSDFIALVDPITLEKSWIAYGPIPQTGWSLGIVFPASLVGDPLESLHARMILVGVVGLALMGVLLIFAARYMVRPIKLLSSSAQKIASGDFSLPPVGTARKDEIGDLARAFMQMEASLSDKKGDSV